MTSSSPRKTEAKITRANSLHISGAVDTARGLSHGSRGKQGAAHTAAEDPRSLLGPARIAALILTCPAVQLSERGRCANRQVDSLRQR